MEQGRSDTNKDEVVIRVRNLHKAFGKKEVLRDVSLDLHHGENLAVIGRSGEGKSVTVKCIIGLLQPDGGTINVLGQEVAESGEAQLRNIQVKVGFLFQGGALYDSMSVRDNLAFPLTRVLRMKSEGEVNSRIEEMLDNVGLKETIDVLPAELSGGMRKRIALARALIMKPEIMLYDEPTTGLDPLTSKEISELIAGMRGKYKTSSIIITHDMACARITTNRMLVLNDGRFVAEGTYDDLEQSDNELVRSFFK